MGIVVFMLSMLLGCVPLAVIYRRILIHAPDRVAQARKQMVLPFGLVLVGFLSLYLLRLIPPVPLSIPYIGVYHAIEGRERLPPQSRTALLANLAQRRPNFSRQPGDKGLRVLPRLLAHPIFRSGDDALRCGKAPRGWALHDSIPSTSWAGVNWGPRLRRENQLSAR
jgi:hypothetical protein